MKTNRQKIPPYYPIFLKVEGQRCVVIGGGKVALRKVRALLECGGDVTVISPGVDPKLITLVHKKTIRLIRRRYRKGDLTGAAIVIASTDQQEINRRIAEEARKAGALVNVVDDPEFSSFIIPSYFRTGGLTLVVSTGGESPALARKIRTKLQSDFGKEYAALLSLVGKARSTLKQQGIRIIARRWQKALDLELLARLLRAGKQKEAERILLCNLTGHL